MDKRIYSLNLITYIYMATDLLPTIDTEDGQVYYAVFPICHGVSIAIKQFRKTNTVVELHKFLASYRDIRSLIRDKRGEGYVE